MLIEQMPRGVKKENLPSKVCVVCLRPFTWRKKWERCWHDVTTCSKACNGTRKQLNGATEIFHSDVDDADSNLDEYVGSKAEVAVDAEDARQQRKAAAKAAKALTRAKREGNAPSETGQKSCDLCGRGSDLLVRCQTDVSQAWRMVCGKCWKKVSGGQVDGDASHPHYRYGGLWKNRKAPFAGAGTQSAVKDVSYPRVASGEKNAEALQMAPKEASNNAVDAGIETLGDSAYDALLRSMSASILSL
jgi:hypothetical protein